MAYAFNMIPLIVP